MVIVFTLYYASPSKRWTVKTAKIELFNYIGMYNITCDQMYNDFLQDKQLRNIEKLVAPSILQRIKTTVLTMIRWIRWSV